MLHVYSMSCGLVTSLVWIVLAHQSQPQRCCFLSLLLPCAPLWVTILLRIFQLYSTAALVSTLPSIVGLLAPSLHRIAVVAYQRSRCWYSLPNFDQGFGRLVQDRLYMTKEDGIRPTKGLLFRRPTYSVVLVVRWTSDNSRALAVCPHSCELLVLFLLFRNCRSS